MKARVAPFALAAALLLGSGCVSIARVTNFEDSRCQDSFRKAVAKVLEEEGESPEHSADLADRMARTLVHEGFTPRPFLIPATSGTDYTMFIEKTSKGCLLRLVEKQKGFTRYTNNLTYINTKPVQGCDCKCTCQD